MKNANILVFLAAMFFVVAMVNLYQMEPSRVTERIDPGPSEPSGGAPGGASDVGNAIPGDHELLVQISQLRTLLAEKPDDLEHIIRLANLLFDQGEFVEAAQWYEKALGQQSGNVPVRIDYAVCLFNTGNANGALTQLNQALALDPNNVVGLFNLGVINNEQGNADAAKAAWEKVVSIEPTSTIGRKAQSGLQSLNASLKKRQ